MEAVEKEVPVKEATEEAFDVLAELEKWKDTLLRKYALTKDVEYDNI